MRIDRRDRGVALLIVLLVLSLGTAIGVALMDLVTEERRIADNRTGAMQALNVALGGMGLAKRELAHDAAWPGGTSLPFGNGESFDVEITPVSANEAVISVSPEIPNDGVQFHPTVSEEIRERIIPALLEIIATDAGKEAFTLAYQWGALERHGDDFYDPFRQVLQASGLKAEDLQ